MLKRWTPLPGSIAKKIRQGDGVSLVCIGSASVCITVKAIIIARRYLRDDEISLRFKPEFVHVEMKDGQRSAIKFHILTEPLPPRVARAE